MTSDRVLLTGELFLVAKSGGVLEEFLTGWSCDIEQNEAHILQYE